MRRGGTQERAMTNRKIGMVGTYSYQALHKLMESLK